VCKWYEVCRIEQLSSHTEPKSSQCPIMHARKLPVQTHMTTPMNRKTRPLNGLATENYTSDLTILMT
jgi:hypothetical protein